MPRIISKSFERDLLQLARSQSYQLLALKSHWPRLENTIHKSWEAKTNRIPIGDPIMFPVDLLTPLACINDETLHTRALAYLLNNDNRHGFGKEILSSLLRKIVSNQRGSVASEILSLLNRKKSKISVIPEFRYHIEDSPDRSFGRCDIWIEIAEEALVIIENKIGSEEGMDSKGKGQTKWYKEKAQQWCKARKSAKRILIYLTREGVDKKNWVSLSYLDLASALRKAWYRNPHVPGRGWLGLYIAAIMRGVLEIDVENWPQDVELADLITYIGRAHQ